MLMVTFNANKKKHIRQNAFTVVELIVVIVVIGILASVAIVSYSDSQKRAQKSTFDANAQQVKLKLGDYMTDNNKYPVTKSEVVTYLSSTGSTSLSTEFNKSVYSYAPTTNSGGVCSTTVACEKYTITVAKSGWNGSASDTNITVTP